ncbi:MAG TPA: ComF family protein [Burkholderiaceae bacterium]|nr:ComF family protein [Burkholderiaceae bacterium]
MAYLSRLGDPRFWLTGAWRQWLPGVCSLCRQSARAWGLCVDCHDYILATRAARILRCLQCDVGLDASASATAQARCAICIDQDPAFERLLTVFDYEAPADLLIHQFKSRHQFFLAPVLAGMMWQTWVQRGTALQPPIVLGAVPASRPALRRRGFNPAAELARYVARYAGWPFEPGLLIRTREGRRQATLGREARREATTGLYQPARWLTGSIVVVDDVITTGSTMDSVARSLRQVGAESVHGLALGRTPPAPEPIQ